MQLTKKKKKRKIYSKEDYIFDTVNYIILTFVVIVTLYPFLNTLAVSFNDALDSVRGGIYLWPRKFTLYNYTHILGDPQIYRAALVSVSRALITSVLNVACSLVVGYVLTRKDFVLRGFYSKIFMYSMYISGGMIPMYFLIRDLGLQNNFLVYVLPGIVSAWNIMVVRSYIDGLPDALIESAKIDGANELTIIFKIIMPLCVPVLATVALFVAVGQWNSWFDTMLYCSGDPKLSTLQYELQKVLKSSSQVTTAAAAAQASQNGASNSVTPNAVRSAMTIVAVAPILFAYPFLQKYFVSGLTLGGVKG